MTEVVVAGSIVVVVAGLVVVGAVVVELPIHNSLVGGLSNLITVWREGANKRREASFSTAGLGEPPCSTTGNCPSIDNSLYS